MAIYSKETFFNNFEIEKMNNKSLTIVEKRTYEHMFISRTAFNAIMRNEVTDIRVVELHSSNGCTCKWLQVLIWTAF